MINRGKLEVGGLSSGRLGWKVGRGSDARTGCATLVIWPGVIPGLHNVIMFMFTGVGKEVIYRSWGTPACPTFFPLPS